MPISRRAKRPFKFHALALMLVSTGLAAQTATCDSTIYLSQGNPGAVTALQRSPGTLPVNFTTAGASATRTYNSLGLNPLTGNLYGITANGNELVQVNAATGATTDLGGITGLPQPSVDRFNSGAFSADGTYYVKPFGNSSALYRIDVTASPPTSTLITLSQAFTTSDMAWSGSLMYSTADNGQLYSIDVATGTTTAIGAPDATGGVLGAQFSGTNGLFGAANNGSGMYRINLGTGQRDKISNAPASGNNDGASCPNVALFEPLPPEPQSPTAVPTLDIAGLGLLGLLSAGLGALGLRRRKRGQTT